MIRRFVDLLDESTLACNIAMGLAIATVVLFGLATLASLFFVFMFSPLWVLGFLLCGFITGVAGGVVGYIYSEHIY